MAWTAPKTWAALDVPTAALFNAHIRDNMLILKTPFSDDGKVRAIDATCFASLAGTNLTGVGKLAAANTWTAGKQNYNAGATTRVIIPTLDVTGAAAGSMAVEGDYLHYMSATAVEWRWLGADVGLQAGSIPGSIWIDDDGMLHYIDDSSHERQCYSNSTPHTDANAVSGSLWIEGDYMHWVYTSGAEKLGHYNVAHVDGNPHTDDHDDVAHVNIAYGDSGGGPHGDTYTDHDDSPYYVHEHGDWDDVHVDTPHDDHAHDDWDDEHTHHGDTAYIDLPVLV